MSQFSLLAASRRLRLALFAFVLAASPLNSSVTKVADSGPREVLEDHAENGIVEPAVIVVAGSALVAVSMFARRRRPSGSPD